ncbi:hypothetical protein MHF_0862 [Mycoplasma haemofelis Ohio2]|uniref:Uncharacterized protein n=1 Tax=Mycoplasma haemofelis (strain Ohio2) TaxID=859194 RepID=F6FIS8_MYCHI|nr:hypothetical protein MHF_0862 [Mycoplasma haemofelis Ohio2]
MNKLLPATGAIGASVAAAGGYMLLGKESEFNTTKVSETFTERYSKAVLSDEDPLWDSKLTALESNGHPVHTTLIEAKSTIKQDKTRAKQLLVEGCKEIYASQLESSLHASDFKSYCAKTIKDGMQGTWISEDPTGRGTKWDTALLSFESHKKSWRS